MRKNILVLILLVVALFDVAAQDEDKSYSKIKPNFSIEGGFGQITNGGRDGATLIDQEKNTYPAFNFLVGWQSKPDGKLADIAELLNYPVYGFGLGYEKFSSMGFNYDDSRLSDMFNIFGFFEGYFYKNNWFSVGLALRIGLGITFDIYDINNNPNNVHFGAPTSLFVGGGPTFRFRPTQQLELGVNTFIWHHSNGHTWEPNTGINQRGINILAKYSLEQPYSKQRRERIHKGEFKDKGFLIDIFGHNGTHAYKAEYFAFNAMVRDYEKKKTDFTSWQRLGVAAACSYRYGLLCSTGLEVDLTYMWGLDHLEAADRVLYGDAQVDASRGYTPLMITGGFVQEFYYGNVSAYIGGGFYLLHNVGIYEDSSRMYQKIGMRFYIPKWNNIFLGWNMLARNFTEADHFELQLGVRIKTGRKNNNE